MNAILKKSNVIDFQEAAKVRDEQVTEVAFADFLSRSADQKPELVQPITTAQYEKTMSIKARIAAARARVAAEELQEG